MTAALLSFLNDWQVAGGGTTEEQPPKMVFFDFLFIADC